MVDGLMEVIEALLLLAAYARDGLVDRGAWIS
jgi:hypothetical protein